MRGFLVIGHGIIGGDLGLFFFFLYCLSGRTLIYLIFQTYYCHSIIYVQGFGVPVECLGLKKSQSPPRFPPPILSVPGHERNLNYPWKIMANLTKLSNLRKFCL